MSRRVAILLVVVLVVLAAALVIGYTSGLLGNAAVA
ncbi:hypothetical protein BWL13_00407 [Microbacterium oleivorans]|uniref:Uncharacterized protein n=1 Tax=Microbacterium oleivorans TaxID=273677 RepID=A0A031FTY7_9MICO|nr:hypothetical protein BWL13_00407 [Microbacterium oleivorans]EZP28299.1 hypothetical protein BW34_01279 [Microbacterium oleivorans]